MISVTATAMRDGSPREIPVSQLVRGDVVTLAAGDMIPADVRILNAKDLFVTQGSLTGESFPVEKFEIEHNLTTKVAVELSSIAFLGTSVESGSALGIVVATGKDTYLGGMAQSISEQPAQTAFDKGIANFTWLMLRFVVVMVPLVFVINGLTKGNWGEVDAEQIEKPQPWDIKQLTRFIVFIGPCSSIFDYTTFLIMLYIFGCWDLTTPALATHSQSLFQTGWFVESLITQTLIIHVIRTNRIPFLQSWASWPLLLTSFLIMLIGIAIPFTLVGDYLGFTVLPKLYWPLLGLSLLCYVVLTQAVKTWLLHRKWI